MMISLRTEPLFGTIVSKREIEKWERGKRDWEKVLLLLMMLLFAVLLLVKTS